MNLGERLRKIRYELALSAEDIAKTLKRNGIKMTSRTIYSYELNERQPNANYLQALVDYFDINPSWLLSNDGEIFNSIDVNKQGKNISDMVMIPLLSLNASAGYGSLIEDRAMTKDFIAFSKNWLDSVTYTNPKHLTLFTVKGDSMEGAINDGDLILVNDTLKDLKRDGIYVVSIDNELYVKTLQRMPGNQVQVVSENQRYKPYTINLDTEHFQIIGKVIWSGHNIS